MLRKIVTYLVFFLIAGGALHSQDIILPEDEAKEALFQTRLGDAEVNLYLEGSWNLSLTGGYGFLYDSLSETFSPSVFPGMSSGFLFSQVPDLTISLYLMERYFFEASILDDYEQNTYLLGYNGKPGEFLQRVRIGNTDIGVDTYGFLQVPAASTSALGGTVKFGNSSSTYEGLIRFDPAAPAKISYLGDRLVKEYHYASTDYQQGRFFILPDRDIEGLKVYVEDDAGTFTGSYLGESLRFRGATSEEAELSSEKGIVSFKVPQERKIAVFYSKGGDNVGEITLGKNFLPVFSGDYPDPSTLEDYFFARIGNYFTVPFIRDYSDYEITGLEGNSCLLIYNPGEWGPFERFGAYPVDDTLPGDESRITMQVESRDSRTSQSALFRPDPDHQVIWLLTVNDDPRSPENRYPLQGYGVQGAYGPLASDDEGKILLYLLDEPSEYRLGPGVIEGSVQILINDIPDSAFSVNYSTGEIIINRIIAPEDRIDIFYRIEGGATQGGDLIGLFGGKFTFSSALTGEIGMGSRWSLNPSAYTEEFGANPGSIMFTGSLNYQKDNLSASLSAGFSLSTPDTTGILRLFGMEEDDYQVSIGDYNIFPGSLSRPLSLIPADRGILYYKDYHAYSAGGALQDIAWPLPDDQSYLYENGGRTGPYAAKASSEGFSGTVMVLDYELESGEWVAGQIPLCDQSVPPDLSSYEEIEFSIRLLDENDPTDIDLYFEAGSLGEDLDGDGILDAETSVYSSGFTYNPEAGLSFPLGDSPTGGGNGRIDTEDFNGNGALDKEHDGILLSEDISPLLNAADTSTTIVRIPLTADMKARLASASAIRLVIVSNAASTTTGKLLISKIRFHGSSFIPADPVTLPHIGKETDTGSNSLLLLHPEVETTFHPGEISQDVLTVTLAIPSTSGTITAYTPPIPQTQYRYLTFYLKASAGSTGTASVSYTDGAKGVTGTIPLSGLTSWTRVDFDLELETEGLLLNGVESGSININPGGNTFTTLSLEISGGTSGDILFLDEVHLNQSRLLPAAGAEGKAAWQVPGTIIQIGDFPLFADFTLEQTVSLATPTFGSGFQTFRTEEVLSPLAVTRTEIGFNLATAKLTGELTGSWEEDQARFGGGHDLKVPLFSRFLFQDSYSYREEGTSGSRFTGIEITGGDFASGVSSEAIKGQNGLSQTWDIHSSFRPSEWISWSISGDFNQFSPAYYPEPSNYFNDWINDFVLILPLPAESGETPSRRGSVEVSSFLGETGQPVKLSTISDYEVTGISERSRKDSLDCRLELPFPLISPSGKELLLRITYGKVLTRTAPNSPAGDFFDDSGRYFQSIGKMTPLLSTLPLIELFDPGIYSSFSSLTGDSWMASMNPEFILSLSRSYGSSINDLFIPYLWETSISRQMNRNGDTLGDDLVVSLIAYNRALNLFGKMGIHPLFSFYLTDEFSSSITYLGNFSRETAGINNLIQTTGYLTLFGTEERKLDIDASFSVSWPELFTVSGDIGTKVSWEQRTEKTLNNPLTGEGEYPLSFLHTVSFSIEGEYTVTPLFLTEGGFSSKLLIGDIASISGTLLAGVQWEKPSSEQIIFRGGVNGIIEAKLSF